MFYSNFFNPDEPKIEEIIPSVCNYQDLADFADFEGLSCSSELPDGNRLSFAGDVENEDDFPY